MSVEAYLNKGIKEIITEFPEVEEVLNEFEIGCSTCGEGLCLLKDIVEIHYLDEEVESELMARISNALFPDKAIKFPKRIRKPKGSREINYSPPMKKMVDEHVLIKRWLALLPKVIENLDLETEEGLQLINKGMDFIRNFADKYHHAKEEDETFKYFDENFDMIKVIRNDHVRVRGHVKEMLEAIESKDKVKLAEQLKFYSGILPEHIKKEDEILFPWMDRNLTTNQIGQLYSRFNEIDEEYGDSPEKHRIFIEELENKFC
ncbi:MAG: hemerythrin domain-containing protein [Candidatus Lokiarchaeota archaeon]|nr:hemerythrin domain-containing protein [Candidatus Lokiarchaeota archaeon]